MDRNLDLFTHVGRKRKEGKKLRANISVTSSTKRPSKKDKIFLLDLNSHKIGGNCEKSENSLKNLEI